MSNALSKPLISTAGNPVFKWYSNWQQEVLTCSRCGWRGTVSVDNQTIAARQHFPLLRPTLWLYKTTSGRIMSCSSCSRMWQCQTYSLPPVRGLAGTTNGTVGSLNCMITVVTSPGFILMVSFHPASFGLGGRAAPLYMGVPL
jgi:hypothetical protein